jgi:hypothetical protein
MIFSSMLKSMIPQMLASGQFKKVEGTANTAGVEGPPVNIRGMSVGPGVAGVAPVGAPASLNSGGFSGLMSAGPMQGSGVAVATPGGAPAAMYSGGGFNSGLMSLLNDPNVRARLNLGSSPSAQEQSTVTASEPAQPTFQELYMSSPEYMSGLSSFSQRLSPSSRTPQQNYLDLYNQMALNTKNINPFNRPDAKNINPFRRS